MISKRSNLSSSWTTLSIGFFSFFWARIVSKKKVEYTVFENHRKVSFNIASEATYVFSVQKFIKNAIIHSF